MAGLIVADSSPIISFARAKKLHLIRDVYELIRDSLQNAGEQVNS